MEFKMKIGRKVYTLTDKSFVKFYNTARIYVCDQEEEGGSTVIDMRNNQFEKLAKEGYLLKYKRLINKTNKTIGFIYAFNFDKLLESDYIIKTQSLYKYVYGRYTYGLTMIECEVSEDANSYLIIKDNKRVSKNDIGCLRDSYGDLVVYLKEKDTDFVKQLIKQRLDYELECAKSAYDRALTSYKNKIEALNKI